MFELTLSFDNGPEAGVTPGVLDVLARHGLRASFFVIGGKLADPRARLSAERASAEGHWIGNHTWSHSTPLGDSADPDIAEHEIGRTQRELGLLAHERRFFRPFAGGGGVIGPRLLSPAVVDFLVRERYSCVLWNAVPKDWEDPDGWVDTALAQCRSQPWSLMVLHDLPTGAMKHLDRFLDRVHEAGGQIRQDFPPDCVPIRRGVISARLDPYVAAVK
jgi:peptidoglycan/xylan/chitin deacetylase (PgdA/CDA1 family)